MRAELKPHPDSPCPAVAGITVEAERERQRLILRYRLTGKIGALIVPPPAEPARADGLWRHSCFEAFLASPAGDGYVELNFSPSSQWAAYRFDSYRSGMTGVEGVEPRIGCTVTADSVTMDVELGLDLPGPWRVGLSAVVETADGTLSYWALRHPPGRPDFHHPYCFALELAPAA